MIKIFSLSGTARKLLGALLGALAIFGNIATAESSTEILFLGDSYTIGEGVDRLDAWPHLLAEQLSQNDGRRWHSRVIARTGWTTADLSAAISRQQPRGGRPMVTLMIGVNDQFQGVDIQTFRKHFKSLLGVGAGLTDKQDAKQLLVVSIPDYSVTAFGRQFGGARAARELRDFNVVIREETAAFGARYVNVTDLSQQAAENSALLADDGLHPSRAMYQLWLQRLLPQAQSMLSIEP